MPLCSRPCRRTTSRSWNTCSNVRQQSPDVVVCVCGCLSCRWWCGVVCRAANCFVRVFPEADGVWCFAVFCVHVDCKANIDAGDGEAVLLASKFAGIQVWLLICNRTI